MILEEIWLPKIPELGHYERMGFSRSWQELLASSYTAETATARILAISGLVVVVVADDGVAVFGNMGPTRAS